MKLLWNYYEKGCINFHAPVNSFYSSSFRQQLILAGVHGRPVCARDKELPSLLDNTESVACPENVRPWPFCDMPWMLQDFLHALQSPVSDFFQQKKNTWHCIMPVDFMSMVLCLFACFKLQQLYRKIWYSIDYFSFFFPLNSLSSPSTTGTNSTATQIQVNLFNMNYTFSGFWCFNLKV